MFSSLPEFLTPNEAAQYLGVPVTTIKSLMKEGRLPAIEFAGVWRVHRETLEERRWEYQWCRRAGRIAMVHLDELSILVLSKAASRFSLKADHYETGMEALEAVSEGTCTLLVLNESLPDMDSTECYAGIRALNNDLPAAVMCERLVSEEYGRFMFKGGPVTFINRPIQFFHAERLFAQFGFDRSKR